MLMRIIAKASIDANLIVAKTVQHIQPDVSLMKIGWNGAQERHMNVLIGECCIA